MPYYRLYFLENNHIRHFVELNCESDEQAIEHVDAHADGRAMELWQGHRMVKAFEGREQGAARG